MLIRVLQMLRHERILYVPWAFVRMAREQLIGRLYARLMGWTNGYIGPGGRVIGSSHIDIGPRAHINRYAWIEAVYRFRDQRFEPTIRIGKDFSASDRLHISCIGSIEVGDDCLIGSSVYISDHNHGIYDGTTQSLPGEAPIDRALQCEGCLTIGSRVWIGDNVVIVGAITIGDGVIIGANSVVKRDIPPNTICAGAPLRMLKKFNPISGKWEKNDDQF